MGELGPHPCAVAEGAPSAVAVSATSTPKALHLLRQVGWIETRRRRILVQDLAALRDYAR